MRIQPARTSTGAASGHAGEFVQGAVEDAGKLRRVLVSIPAPALRSTAVFADSPSDELTTVPAWKQKSLRAFQLTWRLFSDASPKGQLTLTSNIPVSRGMGSSTADCVAAIRAAASWFGSTLDAAQVAALAHQSECFSDATMCEDHLVVFQHCEGLIREDLPGEIPNFGLVIVESRTGVATVETDLLSRPQYTAAEIQLFSESLARLRSALVTNDVKTIAQLSEISAGIDQKYHPKPQHNKLFRIARECDALGVAAAHSGDIRVLLYRPCDLTNAVISKLHGELESCGLRCWRTLSTREEKLTATHVLCG